MAAPIALAEFHLLLEDPNPEVAGDFGEGVTLYGKVSQYTLPVVSEEYIEATSGLSNVPYPGRYTMADFSFQLEDYSLSPETIQDRARHTALFTELMADGTSHKCQVDFYCTSVSRGTPVAGQQAPVTVTGRSLVYRRMKAGFGLTEGRTDTLDPNVAIYRDVERGIMWANGKNLRATIEASLGVAGA